MHTTKKREEREREVRETDIEEENNEEHTSILAWKSTKLFKEARTQVETYSINTAVYVQSTVDKRPFTVRLQLFTEHRQLSLGEREF